MMSMHGLGRRTFAVAEEVGDPGVDRHHAVEDARLRVDIELEEDRRLGRRVGHGRIFDRFEMLIPPPRGECPRRSFPSIRGEGSCLVPSPLCGGGLGWRVLGRT